MGESIRTGDIMHILNNRKRMQLTIEMAIFSFLIGFEYNKYSFIRSIVNNFLNFGIDELQKIDYRISYIVLIIVASLFIGIKGFSGTKISEILSDFESFIIKIKSIRWKKVITSFLSRNVDTILISFFFWVLGIGMDQVLK